MSGMLEFLNPYAAELLLLLRLGVGGALVVYHGYPKMKGGRVGAGQWMKSMGIPPVAADLSTIIEFFGGIFLVVGFLTPLVGLFVAILFASIILMKRSKMKAVFHTMEQGKATFELDTLYLLFGLVFLFLGAGTLSLDHLLGI